MTTTPPQPPSFSEDLRVSLTSHLERRGIIDKLRATVRAEVFKAIDPSMDSQDPDAQNPNVTPKGDVLLVNEIFREYLSFMGYSHTLGVFEAEASMPTERVPRTLIKREIGIEQTSTEKIPLIYGLTETIKTMRRVPLSALQRNEMPEVEGSRMPRGNNVNMYDPLVGYAPGGDGEFGEVR